MVSKHAYRVVVSLSIAVAACGFPRPADVGDAGPGSPGDDAGTAAAPDTVVHVSPTGDDAADGIASPVKTLQRAIAVASANTKIIQIALATGDYSTSGGEAFPYTIPPNVTIVGPAGGGAVLSGDKTTAGVTLNASGLQDVELEDFATAVTVTGPTNLKNVTVQTSMIAVDAETTGVVTADNLTISGTVGACSAGIVLKGAASLTATAMETHNLGTTLDARDQSVTSISSAMLFGDANCNTVVSVVSSGSFRIADSVLDGGNAGMTFTANSAAFQAVVTNTSVRHMKTGALAGGFGGAAGSFHMTGGELTTTASTAVQIGPGTWTFTNVSITQNQGLTIYLQNGSLVMRSCTVVGNGSGIDVFVDSTADLGTAADPGNNVFQNNGDVAVDVQSSAGVNGIAVTAVGNTWDLHVQGADANGKYTSRATIVGPVAIVTGNNYAVDQDCRLSL